MSAKELNDLEWQIIGELARSLVEKGVSHNLVKQAMVYLGSNPTRQSAAALLDYLSRLERLQDTFSSGEKMKRERQNLIEIVQPRVKLLRQADWSLILGWTARLMQAMNAARQDQSGRQYQSQRARR